MINKKINECVLGFEPVNERMFKLHIKGKLYNTTYICNHAPTEDATDEYKEKFYEYLQNVCSKVLKYDALFVIGDFNAKDMRVYREVNCDSDHFLLIATIKEKTCRIKNISGEMRKKWNTEKLKDDTTVDLHKKEIEQDLKKTIPSDDIEEE
ncbi:unnamed protein product [Euphydryas editha]|uniref:Endonuclease/exonuclease/phosphatase domain-containing protein n=1 Tax=Euphydryas editha TaxID=104508 RepID=A0AAU9UFB2_EUPED|nr:unnamed protein product [Euphydryas editha]